MKEIILKVSNVKKKFRLSRKQQKIDHTKDKYKVAVDGVSFDAFRGEIFGLLGPNGAGKTTTLRIISTLINADEGDVWLCNYNIKSQPYEVRKKIGFLTSELKLENFFTPNYLFDYYGKLHKVDENVLKSRKLKLFEKFGIDKFAEVKVGELSTGMKQKVSLAVSLVHDPEVIIFDEPTNGLDVITAKTVTDFLLELKDEGKSIIVSTHIFSLVEKICDRVGVIINGRMVADSPLEELVKDKKLEDVFFDLYVKSVGDEK